MTEVALVMGQVLREIERSQELFGLESSPRPGAHEFSLRRQRALLCGRGRSLGLGSISSIPPWLLPGSLPGLGKSLLLIQVLKALVAPSMEEHPLMPH